MAGAGRAERAHRQPQQLHAGQLSAAKAGIGVAALPTTLGDAEETPVQVLPPVDELARSWFLLTHPDLRRTPRIAAFVDHVLEDIPALRRALIG